MSKKSRRRNKKILAVLGALGGAALMANKKRNASIQANEAKESGFDIPAVVTTPKDFSSPFNNAFLVCCILLLFIIKKSAIFYFTSKILKCFLIKVKH